MLRLCPLTLLVVGNIAVAASGNVKTLISHISSSGSLDINGVTPSGLSGINTSYFLTSPTIKNYWTIATNVNVNKVDYSNYFVRTKKGIESSLKTQFDDTETDGSVNLNYQRGRHNLNATMSSSITDSPFYYRGQSTTYGMQLRRQTSSLQVGYYTQSRRQPLSYFIDRDFRNKQRPQQVDSKKIEFSYEQIWTSRYKTHVKIFGGARDDRPDHSGAELRQAYAITDQFFYKLYIGQLVENSNQQLKNERGYFDVSWLESQLDFQPNFDWTISLFAGANVEREVLPETPVKQIIGTDTWGIKASYEGLGWSANSTFKLQKSNTGFSSETISGGISWDI